MPRLPLMDGVVNVILGTVAVLPVIGLIAPLRMIPILLFEIVWKLIWTLSVALPRVQAGQFDEDMAATLFACAWAIPFVFIVPWQYVF